MIKLASSKKLRQMTADQRIEYLIYLCDENLKATNEEEHLQIQKEIQRTQTINHKPTEAIIT